MIQGKKLGTQGHKVHEIDNKDAGLQIESKIVIVCHLKIISDFHIAFQKSSLSLEVS